MKNIEKWLADWDALNVERERIAGLFEEANGGNTAALYKADEATTDLHEVEADFAHSAAEILRELYVNSTLPEDRGEKVWRHLDGEQCTEDAALVTTAADAPGWGICHEHDRRVRFS